MQPRPHYHDGEAAAIQVAGAAGTSLAPLIASRGAAAAPALRLLAAALGRHEATKVVLLDGPLLDALVAAAGAPGGAGAGGAGAAVAGPLASVWAELSAALELAPSDDFDERGISGTARRAARASPALVKAAAWFKTSCGDFRCASGASGVLIR